MAAPLLGVAVMTALGVIQGDDGVQRTAFLLALVWAVAGQYFLHRGMWPGKPPDDAPCNTGLAFYRQEVRRRRNLFRRVLPWSFGPIALATVAFIFPSLRSAPVFKGPLPATAPFAIVLFGWIAAFFLVRLRAGRELQCDVDELDEIERDQERR